MWPFSKTSDPSAELPGVKFNRDGSMEFELTEEEMREVDQFLIPLKQYKFHPEIADILPKAATACALSKYASGLIVSLTFITSEKEYEARKPEVMATLNRAIAAGLKAVSLYELPQLAKNLASYYEIAGRRKEMKQWQALYQKRKATWTPSQLDELLLKWLEA